MLFIQSAKRLWITLLTCLLGFGGAVAQDKAHQSSWQIGAPVRTEDGQKIPAGGYGIVVINSPREATLLHLRGMAGHGKAVLRMEKSRDCLALPLRFVAGDFGGRSISVRSAEPVRMILQSARVAKALADGQDIVSNMYRVSSLPVDPDADIILQNGLSAEHGFVLNPGSSILADVLGATTTRIACSEF